MSEISNKQFVPELVGPQVGWGTFAGLINQDGIGRIFQACAVASQRGYTVLHLVFQSAGGVVGDGIALYNYFRALPIELHLYNAGTVASIAVLAYLGAHHRWVSRQATFTLQKSTMLSGAPLDAAQHRAFAEYLAIEDARAEAIVRTHARIPAERWQALMTGTHDIAFRADEAVEFGIAEGIREFEVPAGQQLFNF
jgi:ATP-dependent protease ClpP protease subunit